MQRENLPNPHSKRPQKESDMQGRCCKTRAVSRQFSLQQAFKKSTVTNAVTSWAVNYNLGAFGPRKASKVEKPSSRGVSSLHRWSLMLLPVLRPMPLCALCSHVCVSTSLCLLSFGSPPHCCSFPELGPMTQIDISASMWLHINIAIRTNK